MASPFTTTLPSASVEDATNNQITNALIPMLRDRNWRTVSNVKTIERCVVLNMVLGWATEMMSDETPSELQRVLRHDVPDGDAATLYGRRVNAILAHLAAQQTTGIWNYKPFTKSGASQLITWLATLSMMKRPETACTLGRAAASVGTPNGYLPDVPAGRYAIDTRLGAVNEIAFYKVDRPTEGRWAGYVFVTLITGSDEQRLSREASKAVLAKIAAVGPEVASARYGHEIGECGVCGRRLTNDESRARGIGPVCAAKAGW